MTINTDCRPLWSAHTAAASAKPAECDFLQAELAGAGALAASIAHEVTQPLAAIALNAQAALHCFECRQPPTQLHAALRAVIEASAQANAIVRSIRDLTARRRTAPAGAHIDATLAQLLDQLSGDLQLHDIEVRVDLADAARALRADPVQLQQLLRNLLANAIESMHEVDDRPRELVVRSYADGAGFLVVTVSDAGVGISANVGQAVFDSLYSTKPDGMGMGLAICRAIVAAHGGHIRAERGRRHGSVFTFSLPFADQQPWPYP